jgi:hypothetical protein
VAGACGATDRLKRTGSSSCSVSPVEAFPDDRVIVGDGNGRSPGCQISARSISNGQTSLGYLTVSSLSSLSRTGSLL